MQCKTHVIIHSGNRNKENSLCDLAAFSAHRCDPGKRSETYFTFCWSAVYIGKAAWELLFFLLAFLHTVICTMGRS